MKKVYIWNMFFFYRCKFVKMNVGDFKALMLIILLILMIDRTQNITDQKSLS